MSRQKTGPLEAEEFGQLMAVCGLDDPAEPLAVGVSGGSDSMALVHLLAGSGRRVTALHVDHGLRPSSAEEAEQVRAWMDLRDIPCEVLTITEPKPESGIQAWARTHRYSLMEEWCRKSGINHLLLAHQMEDQAETFLLRLARGSGLAGLACMRPTSDPLTDGHSFPLRQRPLLTVSRARLRQTLEAASIRWLDDPSNENEAFDRIKARKLLSDPVLPGLTAERLAQTATHLARAQSMVDWAVIQLAEDAVTVQRNGYLTVAMAPLVEAEPEVALRLLARLLEAWSADGQPPRFEAVEALWTMLSRGRFRGGTLAGLQLENQSGGTLLIAREISRIAPNQPVAENTPTVWDRRFLITAGRGTKPGLSVGPLGSEGVRQLREKGRGALVVGQADLIRRSLPALWRHEELVGLPTLGMQEEDSPLVACEVLTPQLNRAS